MHKLPPKFDGPFTLTALNEAHSTVILDILGLAANRCHIFHTSQVKPYVDLILDKSLERGEESIKTTMTLRTLKEPIPIQTWTGPEYIIERILQHYHKGHSYEFLVQWRDFSNCDEHNE